MNVFGFLPLSFSVLRTYSKERGGEAVEAFLKEAQLIRNYPVYKFSRDDKALDLVQRDH